MTSSTQAGIEIGEAEIITPMQSQEGQTEQSVRTFSSKPETAAAVRIENLTKRYGDLTAVDNLSLSVPTGKMFGFLDIVNLSKLKQTLQQRAETVACEGTVCARRRFAQGDPQ